MKILFDQNMPWNLKAYLPLHEVEFAEEQGWGKLENGALLRAAEDSGFEVFITGDQSLRYQQNLSTRVIAIVELTKNNWPSLEPQLERIVKAVNTATPGSYQTIECPYVYRGRNRRKGKPS